MLIQVRQIRIHPVLHQLIQRKAVDLRQILIHQIRIGLPVLQNIAEKIRARRPRQRILKGEIADDHLRQRSLIIRGQRQHVVVQKPCDRKPRIHAPLVPDKGGLPRLIAADEKRADALQNIALSKLRDLRVIGHLQNPEQPPRKGLAADRQIIQLCDDRFGQNIVFCCKIKGLQLQLPKLIQDSGRVLHQLIIFQIQKRRTAPRLVIPAQHPCRLHGPSHQVRVRVQKKPRDPEVLRILTLPSGKSPHRIPCRFIRLAVSGGPALGTQDSQIHSVGIRQVIFEIKLCNGKRRKLRVQPGKSPVQGLQLPDGFLFLVHRQKVMDPVQSRHRIVPVRLLKPPHKASHVFRKRFAAALMAAHLYILLHHLQDDLLLLPAVKGPECRSHSAGDRHRNPDFLSIGGNQNQASEIPPRMEIRRINRNRDRCRSFLKRGIGQFIHICGEKIPLRENPHAGIAPAVPAHMHRSADELRLRHRKLSLNLLLVRCKFHRLFLPCRNQEFLDIVCISLSRRETAVQGLNFPALLRRNGLEFLPVEKLYGLLPVGSCQIRVMHQIPHRAEA